MALRRSGNIPDLNRVTAQLRRDLPLIIANKAKNHYIEGFRRGGGMTDKSRGGWPKRDVEINPRKYSEKVREKSRGRGTLIGLGGGNLWRDIDKRKTTFEEIVIGTLDTDYGVYHNEGIEPQPLREFLGQSRALDAKIDTLIKKKMRENYG